jgi:hypothetical protein
LVAVVNAAPGNSAEASPRMRRPPTARVVPKMSRPAMQARPASSSQMNKPEMYKAEAATKNAMPSRPKSFAERLALLREQESKADARERQREKEEYLELIKGDSDDDANTYRGKPADDSSRLDVSRTDDEDEDDYNPFKAEKEAQKAKVQGYSRPSSDEDEDEAEKSAARKERIRLRLADREALRKKQNGRGYSSSTYGFPSMTIGALNLKERSEERMMSEARTADNPLVPGFRARHEANLDAWRSKMINRRRG